MFPTATAAESHFYDAFSNFDKDQMMAVWADVPEATCIHPGGSICEGTRQIRASWDYIFREKIRRFFRLKTLIKQENASLCIMLVEENISLDGKTPAGPPVYATNFYKRFESEWLMVLHHASPTPFMQMSDDFTFDADLGKGSSEVH
ncbi:MAG: nuclear transport factor 2 family protein [Pseudomonadota bacterium]|nr:nuclear transport factor 2 family protein [Pseudomonadota bacterium]